MRRTLSFSKMLSILLTVILALSIAPVQAYASDGDSFAADGMWYEVISEAEKTVRITGLSDDYNYDAVLGRITVPETVSDDAGVAYKVTEVGENCFRYNSKVVEVNLPDSIMAIGGGAFSDCASLEHLKIPYQVTVLGSDVISYCENLRTIVLPDYLSVCDSENGLFLGCNSLESISISNNNKYHTIDGVLYGNIYNDEKDSNGILVFDAIMMTLIRYPLAKQGAFTIPDDVEVIGQFAFEGINQTTAIIIPDTVKNLRQNSFRLCTSLERVTFLSETPPVITDAFLRKAGSVDLIIYVPDMESIDEFTSSVRAKGKLPGGRIRVEVNPNIKPDANDPNDPGGENYPGSNPGSGNDAGGNSGSNGNNTSGNTGPVWPAIAGNATDYGSTETTSDFRSLQGLLMKAIQTANAANSGEASLRLLNYKSLDHDTLRQLAAAAKASGKSCVIYADTIEGNAVQVRVMFNPANAEKTVLLTGLVNSTGARNIDALFERNFQNKAAVVELAQQGDFGMTVSVAARVNLTGLNKKTLYFYAYDKAKNIYNRIKNPKSRVDKNGYLWFDTKQAGYIIITDRPLQRK